MKRTFCGVVLAALALMWMPSPAQAAPAAVCIAKSLTGVLRMRAKGTCLATEIQIGSFDGTTLQLSGINLQIVSGAGATDAPVNGKGNLIVGYNANTGGHARTGSHNLIVGDEHDYSLYGGLVSGLQNTIAAPWTTVIGGDGNTASGFGATVTGGVDNTASGFNASVSGGQHNTASGQYGSVSGGWCNVAGAGPAPSCTVNTLSAMSVSGGFRNVASNAVASVSGGASNTASGVDASVSGGENNAATAGGAAEMDGECRASAWGAGPWGEVGSGRPSCLARPSQARGEYGPGDHTRSTRSGCDADVTRRERRYGRGTHAEPSR